MFCFLVILFLAFLRGYLCGTQPSSPSLCHLFKPNAAPNFPVGNTVPDSDYLYYVRLDEFPGVGVVPLAHVLQDVELVCDWHQYRALEYSIRVPTPPPSLSTDSFSRDILSDSNSTALFRVYVNWKSREECLRSPPILLRRTVPIPSGLSNVVMSLRRIRQDDDEVLMEEEEEKKTSHKHASFGKVRARLLAVGEKVEVCRDVVDRSTIPADPVVSVFEENMFVGTSRFSVLLEQHLEGGEHQEEQEEEQEEAVFVDVLVTGLQEEQLRFREFPHVANVSFELDEKLFSEETDLSRMSVLVSESSRRRRRRRRREAKKNNNKNRELYLFVTSDVRIQQKPGPPSGSIEPYFLDGSDLHGGATLSFVDIPKKYLMWAYIGSNSDMSSVVDLVDVWKAGLNPFVPNTPDSQPNKWTHHCGPDPVTCSHSFAKIDKWITPDSSFVMFSAIRSGLLDVESAVAMVFAANPGEVVHVHIPLRMLGAFETRVVRLAPLVTKVEWASFYAEYVSKTGEEGGGNDLPANPPQVLVRVLKRREDEKEETTFDVLCATTNRTRFVTAVAKPLDDLLIEIDAGVDNNELADHEIEFVIDLALTIGSPPLSRRILIILIAVPVGVASLICSLCVVISLFLYCSGCCCCKVTKVTCQCCMDIVSEAELDHLIPKNRSGTTGTGAGTGTPLASRTLSRLAGDLDDPYEEPWERARPPPIVEYDIICGRFRRRVRTIDLSRKYFNLPHPEEFQYFKHEPLGRTDRCHVCAGVIRCHGSDGALMPVSVAVKMRRVRYDPAAVVPIQREVEFMADLSHPHIVKTYGLLFLGWPLPTLDDMRALIVMEKCECDLVDVLRWGYLGGERDRHKQKYLDEHQFERDKLPWWKIKRATNLEKLSIIGQITTAMVYLHRKFIRHGDLKLGNILFKSELVIKIGDFGDSVRKSDLEDLSGRTLRTGTPGYMPNPNPPVVEEEEGEATDGTRGGEAKSSLQLWNDVYAFGILIWEIWTGHVSYVKLREVHGMGAMNGQEASLNQVIWAKGLRPPLQNPQLNFIPDGLSDLMQSCWHENPKRRPSFAEVDRILHFVEREVRTMDRAPGEESEDEHEGEEGEGED